MTQTDKVRAALEYASTLIKFCVKPEKCVTRGDIAAGTDVSKSALEIYKEIQEALRELDGMCLVPVEPTEEQIDFGYRNFQRFSKPNNAMCNAYRAMIAAYVKGGTE